MCSCGGSLGDRLVRSIDYCLEEGQRRGHGDLYVKVQVITPESLDEEQREALEAFAEAGGEEIDVEQGFFEKLKNSF